LLLLGDLEPSPNLLTVESPCDVLETTDDVMNGEGDLLTVLLIRNGVALVGGEIGARHGHDDDEFVTLVTIGVTGYDVEPGLTVC